MEGRVIYYQVSGGTFSGDRIFLVIYWGLKEIILGAGARGGGHIFFWHMGWGGGSKFSFHSKNISPSGGRRPPMTHTFQLLFFQI